MKKFLRRKVDIILAAAVGAATFSVLSVVVPFVLKLLLVLLIGAMRSSVLPK